jgi:shikimate kinase
VDWRRWYGGGPRYVPSLPTYSWDTRPALGGGAILDADTRELLAGHRVVHLSMDVEEAARRTALTAARPLLAVNPLER